MPPGYGNSTRFLTIKAIEVTLNERPSEEYKHRNKGRRASSRSIDKHSQKSHNHLKTLYYLKTN